MKKKPIKLRQEGFSVGIRFLRLMLGLSLYSLGIYLTLQANIGYGSWDVFNSGIVEITGLRMGQVSILVGAVIVVYVILQKEAFGLGTIINTFWIGFLLDILLIWGPIPLSMGWVDGLVLMILGLFVIALASYFYIGAGMGTGPRDALMIIFAKKTGWTVGRMRIAIELAVALIGFVLGGKLGIGTLIVAQFTGLILDLVFRLLSFDAKAVVHQNVSEYIKQIKHEWV